jgi:Family of unknown function (DUF6263)
MKNTLLTGLLLASLVACNKEQNTASGQKNDPKNEKTSVSADGKTSETSSENAPAAALPAEKLAFVEQNGLFSQGLKLVVGQTYPFVTKSKVDNSGTGPDGKAMSATETGLDKMNFTVDAYQNGIYSISLVMTEKSNSNSAMGKSISVDSNKPEPAEPALKATWRVNKAMIGQVLKLQLTDKAEVKSITGFEALYKNIEKNLTSLSKDKKELQMALQGIKAGFNEKMIAAQLKKSIAMLPAKGVKVGQTWTESTNLSPDGKIKNTTTYKFLGLQNNAYVVEISGGLPEKTEKQSKDKMTVSMTVGIKQKGLVKFDAQTGWPTQSTLEVSNHQNQTMSDGQKTQSMHMKSVTTTQIN